MTINENWYNTTTGKYICPSCRKEYSRKGICTHILRAHGENNIFQNSGTLGLTWKMPAGYVHPAITKAIERNGELKTYVVTCNNCCVEFNVREYENKFPAKSKYFCSQYCAHTRERSLELRKRLSEAGKNKYTNISFCLCCKKCLKGKRKYCSKNCQNNEKISKYNDMKTYRRACSFKFSLRKYPDKFDFSLIERYGWYMAKNKGNNLGGVSRDHMISIKYGFTNNIPSWIMCHPANCQLKIHNDNVSKGTKCDLTLEEILDKIKNWN